MRDEALAPCRTLLGFVITVVMNRYLAISHALSLLDDPISATAFARAMRANPLFASACVTPAAWLRMLAEEGLLDEALANYQLSPSGRLLQQHILGWSARDQAAIRQQKVALRATSGQAPIDPRCPVCASDFCAQYLFVILLEQLYAGLSNWNAWDVDEPGLLTAALQACYGEQNLILLDQTEPLSARSPAKLEWLAAVLRRAVDLPPELIADFRHRAEQHLLLPPLPDLQLAHSQVSRLRFERGLLPPEQLQNLRQLAYPSLFASAPAANTQFVRLARPGFNPGRDQALLWLADGQRDQLLWLRLEQGQWHIKRQLG